MTAEAAAEALLRGRSRPAQAPPAPGIYAVLIGDPCRLPGIKVEASGILFIGMSKSSLRARVRFTHHQIAASTLRRSLGAILKEQLGLRAIQPEPTALPVNRHHYQFAEETRLGEWMNACLTYGFITIERDIRTVERSLILHLRPPLNLLGWKNPQAEKVESLRNICRAEAWGA
jgi:hypothetical protein